MKKHRIKIALLAFIFSNIHIFSQKLPQLGIDNVQKVIDAMTPEEKAHLLLGTEMLGATIEGTPRMHAPGTAGATLAIPRLGVTSLQLADGPAGLRIEPKRPNDNNSYYATAFPVGTALASTWNLSLIENVGRAIGSEVLDYGIDVLLAPGVNIHRNPLNGRNFEYYSEDPVVTGEIASAYIKGVQSNGVGTSIKHFAANNQETNRLSINEHISERAMREIYLKGFEIAVRKSSPWTVMSSYNKINGIYASESTDLLTNILRKEWGFKGFVMSDWFGGYSNFESTGSTSSNVRIQMQAGNDVLMPGTKFQYENLVKEIKEGTISKAIIDRNLTNVLNVVLRSPSFKKRKFNNSPDLKGNATIARNAASEGMVLLQNKDNTLPYSDHSKGIALFGITSYNFIAGGTGSGDVNEAYTVSLLDGLSNAGYKADSILKDIYVPYVTNEAEKERKRREDNGGILATPKKMPEIYLQDDQIIRASMENAIALITLGRNSGENGDRQVASDFYLGNDEITLLNKVTEQFHKQGKKVIVVLNTGGVIETNTWKHKVDAILLAWQPGQEGGNAVVDVLSGKVTPSGKLTMTFPMDLYNNPSSFNWPGTPASKPADVVYEEGIYVGYRYFSTFGVVPSFAFGSGMSYTNFSYTGLNLSSKVLKDVINVDVTIKNTGKVPGKEVAQLYISAPASIQDKPKIELKSFAKTKSLNPGESEILSFTISAKDLASFNTEKSVWSAESGIYKISVGASSADIKLDDHFSLDKEVIIEKTTTSFTPDYPFSDIRP